MTDIEFIKDKIIALKGIAEAEPFGSTMRQYESILLKLKSIATCHDVEIESDSIYKIQEAASVFFANDIDFNLMSRNGGYEINSARVCGSIIAELDDLFPINNSAGGRDRIYIKVTDND